MDHVETPKQIILRKKEDRRILGGHQWVFSNEIQEIRGSPGAGDLVELITAGGIFLGVGFFHPHSLIAFRLLSRERVSPDTTFFIGRIEQAHRLRQLLYPSSDTYRLVHGEADFLPGLIVDRFDGTIVVQTFSFGMDLHLPVICDALEEVFHPVCIVERNDSPLRTLESLAGRRGVLRGTPGPLEIEEHGLRYRIHPLEGQKTGFYLDQRENHLHIRQYCQGARVLDCFCNDGGFALNAARANAVEVLGIDSSAEAIHRAGENARLNSLQNVRFEEGDVFEHLAHLASTGIEYGVLILDPPSFTRSRKNVQAAKRGYRDLHIAALRILARGGVLVTASCSHHIESDLFAEIVSDSASRAGRTPQLLEWRGAAPDHPVLPGLPETRYLKVGVYRML
jgi:23S rRNA (cytosine1962-C5)-methyltransferase